MVRPSRGCESLALAGDEQFGRRGLLRLPLRVQACGLTLTVRLPMDSSPVLRNSLSGNRSER
jgi:hypothetical protein